MNIEKEAVNMINGENNGCGTLFTGDFYHLDYVASVHGVSLCDGVYLVVREKKESYYNSNDPGYCSSDFFNDLILFELKRGWFSRTEPKPFEDRIKEAIDKKIYKIQEREAELNLTLKKARDVRMSQVKIDQTMASVVGKSIDELKSKDSGNV
jgi:hypothetical protein